MDNNIILSSIRLTDLQDIITDSFNKALKIHSNQLLTPKPEIVDGETLELKFGITRQTLGRWRKQKRIPYIQHGGIIRYDLNKVIEALEYKKHK
ncbi:hypothetical protein [Pedobacter sp. UYP1]|uniref:hypothetical protein n=1 Tax=Pedobacter sp. UYP1 TaxID=1756396 RepID=UPI00339A1856